MGEKDARLYRFRLAHGASPRRTADPAAVNSLRGRGRAVEAPPAQGSTELVQWDTSEHDLLE